MTVRSFVKGLLIALLSGLISSIILLCLVPPISRDALIHHLKVPQLYLEHGGLYEIPSMVFSYNPMNLDLLYMIPLYFGNDIAPKLIHFGFGLATAWLIFGYLRSRCGSSYGLLGALLFLSVPIIIKLSITVYVDLGLIFFTTASLLLFLRWIERDFQFRFLVLSGISCGLALGTKYNGLIPFFLLTVFTPFVYARLSPKRPGFMSSAMQGIIFFCMALLIYSPWGIRNYLWTGNPIYPLYNGFFAKKNIENDVQDVKKGPKRLSPMAHRRMIYGEKSWQILLLPIRVFFQGEDANPQYFDGKMNPYLLVFPFFAFFPIRKQDPIVSMEKKILLFFAALIFLFSIFSTILRIRYISPIIPPLTILSVLGIKNIIGSITNRLSSNGRRLGWGVLSCVLIFFLGMNAQYVYGQFQYVQPMEYLTGKVTREEYITRYRPEYPVMEYINKQLPEDSLVLFLFLGKRGYYCHRPYLFDMKGLTSTLTEITKSSNNPEEILSALKRMGVTHLMVRFDSLENWIVEQLSPEKQNLFKRFISNHTKLLFSNDLYGVACLTS